MHVHDDAIVRARREERVPVAGVDRRQAELDRQLAERVGDASTKFRGVGREREIKPRRELKPPQPPQRILDERGAGMSEDARTKIALTIVWINQRPREGIERVVAAQRR